MAQCTNCIGWEVQKYSDDTGWVAMTEPFLTKAEAYAEMGLHAANPGLQLRVYEALA